MVNHLHQKWNSRKKWSDPIQCGTNPNLLRPPLYRSKLRRLINENAKDVSQPLRRFSGKGNKCKLHMSVTYSMYLDLKPLWVAFKTLYPSDGLVGSWGFPQYPTMEWDDDPQWNEMMILNISGSITLNNHQPTWIFNTVDYFAWIWGARLSRSLWAWNIQGKLSNMDRSLLQMTTAWFCPNLKHGADWNPNCW